MSARDDRMLKLIQEKWCSLWPRLLLCSALRHAQCPTEDFERPSPELGNQLLSRSVLVMGNLIAIVAKDKQANG
jgi:hypothetical protein